MPLMDKWRYRYFIIFIFMLYCRVVYAAVPPCRLLNLTFSLTLTAYSLTVDYLADHTMVRKDIVTASDSIQIRGVKKYRLYRYIDFNHY